MKKLETKTRERYHPEKNYKQRCAGFNCKEWFIPDNGNTEYCNKCRIKKNFMKGVEKCLLKKENWNAISAV